MRYQELIYIQNENSGVRNKDILNVNMSSDMCIFEAPEYSISGASKINCIGPFGTSYVITTATTIPLTVNFTANTSSFTANSATFRYEIYKYNNQTETFVLPSVYNSETFNYSGFSGTSAITTNIPVSGISLDGEYIIKGYYQFDACTNFLNQLGKTVDTLTFRSEKEFGLYNSDLDYYFLAFRGADKPKLLYNGDNTPPNNKLFQQIVLPENGQTNITITNSYDGYFILTLNGLVLAKDLDYSVSGNVISLSGATVLGDIITISYTTNGGNTLVGDNIDISSAIASGRTNAQGSNLAYFNTDTNKYEIYTQIEPQSKDSILVMINGVTLANNIDYYQSTSNPKRIILEGNLIIGDIITIVYFPVISVVNGLITNKPNVTWQISNPPQLVNGRFTLQTSTADTFTTISSSSSQSYVVGQTNYYDSFTASGSVGTKIYCRIKNQKNYVNLCGRAISDIVYSDIIPIVIQSNSINSY